MSKSLGNFFSVRELLDQGYPGEVIRFVFLSTHYSKPMDWTVEKAVGAETKLLGFLELIERYGDVDNASGNKPSQDVVKALSEDLNTHDALSFLNRLKGSADANELAENLLFLGVYSKEKLRKEVEEVRVRRTFDLSYYVKLLTEAREKALASDDKDFSEVDRIKMMLIAADVQVMMSRNGIELHADSDFDPSKLEALK